jgi:XisH protein
LLKDALTVDLGAEKLIAAEKGLEKIAVEVKSFLGDSLIYDFHSALGQMLVYQVNIDLQEPARVLYLAVPLSAYERMTRQRVFEEVAKRYAVNFLVYDPVNQCLVQWIRHSK